MERSLEGILLKSRENRELKLQLQCLNLNEIPDLKEYEWVHELNLGHNKITKLDKDKLPPNLIAIELHQNKISDINSEDILPSIQILNLSLNQLINFDGSHFLNIQ